MEPAAIPDATLDGGLGGFSSQLSAEFEKHAERLRERSRARRDAVKMRASVLDREDREEVNEAASLGKWQPQDEMQGDVNLRTLRTLLKMVDERGFERYACSRAPTCDASMQLTFGGVVFAIQFRSPTQVPLGF